MNNIIKSIALLSCIFLFSCKQKQAAPNPPVPVNLYTVKSQAVVYYDRYPATAQAMSQVNLLPQVQGYITAILFKEGSHVKKGQKLYELYKRLFDANVNAAEDNLKVANGNLKQAQQDADRYTYLNENKAVAKQLYDHAMITLQNSKNQAKSAEEALKTAKTNLMYSTITAPFDGTIGFSMVKVGDLVNVGQTVLNTVSTNDPIGMDFLINEKQLPYFEDIQNGKNPNVDSCFTILLPNNSQYPFPGKISVIDRAVDPLTGSIKVRIVFPNPKYYLRAGMSCIVKVRNQDNTPQMVIPNKAVVEQMGEFFVFVAKDTTMKSGGADASKKGQEPHSGLFAIQKKVQLGETVGPNVIVKSGITDGDKIVIDGLQSLHDGSQITASGKHPQSGKDSSGK